MPTVAAECTVESPCPFGDVSASVTDYYGNVPTFEKSTARADFVSPIPPDRVTYQWLADGVPVEGETGAFIDVAPWHGGGTLAVRVTLTKEGYEDRTVESPAVPVADYPDHTIIYDARAIGSGWSYYPGIPEQFGSDVTEFAGSVGEGRPLQALQVWTGSTVVGQSPMHYGTETMHFRAHVQGRGWLPEVNGGDEYIGTVGEGRALEAFTFTISGRWAEFYDVYYRAHVSRLGWLGWAKNGEPAGTTGYGNAIEAVQMTIVHKIDAGPVGPDLPAHYDKATQSRVNASAHVQNIGWMAPVSGAQFAGTVGRGLRVEALRFGVAGDLPGGVEASAHVQSIGWMAPVATGGRVGTEGRGLRVEAFRIRLTGKMAEAYDVYYRTHAQSFGWLGWAKNGESSGTAGYAYRLEAVHVVLVPKGGPAPSSTGPAFRQR